MLNCAAFNGRLVADPELKSTHDGVYVCSFTVAVERNYVKQGEERQADFIDVVAWRKAAEFVSKYFRKGSMISVNGPIQTRLWEDKNGNKRKSTEIIADNVSFCGSKKKNDEGVFQEIPDYDDYPDDYDDYPNEEDMPF